MLNTVIGQDALSAMIAKARQEEEVRLTRAEDLQGYPWWRVLLARIWPVYESKMAYLMRIWGLTLDEYNQSWQEPRYESLTRKIIG